MGGVSDIKLKIDAGPDGDDEDLERLTENLRNELLELEIESAELSRDGVVPAHSKVVDPISWGTILLTLAASGGVLTTLIQAVQSWLNRNELNTISLEIDGDKLELKGVSSQQQSQLIEAWLKRHEGGA